AFDNDPSNLSNMWIEYYLLFVSNVSINENPSDGGGAFEQETPKHYMQILKVLHLDSSNILYNYYSDEPLSVVGKQLKRKLVTSLNEKCVLTKRRKLPGYY